MRGTVGKRVSTLSLSALALHERVGQSVSAERQGTNDQAFISLGLNLNER